MATDGDIEKAFDYGNGDDDDGLSVSEASSALQKLSGKSLDTATIQEACLGCSISTSREMSRDEFKTLVRHLERKGSL